MPDLIIITHLIMDFSNFSENFKKMMFAYEDYNSDFFGRSWKISPVAVRECNFMELKPVKRVSFATVQTKVKGSTVEKDPFKRFQSSLARTKSRCIEVLECGMYESYSIMGTLTFAENVEDYNIAYARWHAFTAQLRKKYPHVKYCCVPEKQKRGAFHFHFVLFNLTKWDYWQTTDIVEYGAFSRDLWRFWSPDGYVGKYDFIKVKRISEGIVDIDSVKKVSKYIAKYLTKDYIPVVESHRKLLLVSLGCKRYVRVNDSSFFVKVYMSILFKWLGKSPQWSVVMDFHGNMYEKDDIPPPLDLDMYGDIDMDQHLDKFWFYFWNVELGEHDLDFSLVDSEIQFYFKEYSNLSNSEFFEKYPEMRRYLLNEGRE